MGAEFDRLTASVAALDLKVTAVSDFILNLPAPAATAAQLTAFADAVDASVARLDVAIATPVTV